MMFSTQTRDADQNGGIVFILHIFLTGCPCLHCEVWFRRPTALKHLNVCSLSKSVALKPCVSSCTCKERKFPTSKEFGKSMASDQRNHPDVWCFAVVGGTNFVKYDLRYDM